MNFNNFLENRRTFFGTEHPSLKSNKYKLKKYLIEEFLQKEQIKY